MIMRRVAIILFSLFLLTPLCAQDIYLLSVGISDYSGSDNDLRLASKDAGTVSNLYRKNRNANVVTLLDSKATCKTIEQNMDKLFSKAGKDDIIVLFFSGHGTPNGLVAYDGVFTYDRIRKQLSKSRCTNKMVFADACFSGKLRAGGGKASGSKAKNVMFFLSSRSGETSMEIATMKNGLFTAFLERGLRGGADSDRNRIITAKELFNFVSKGVKEGSRDRQHPVMWGNFRDNMPVMKW